MLFITDNEFERVVSRARNRDIAREYYRRDYVVNVSITIDNRGYYHISGKVMINGNIYLPRVLVNPNSKIVSTDCNCIYADEYTACGHIGALILKVQELSPNTFPYRYAVDLEKRAQEEKIFDLDKGFHRLLYVQCGCPYWYDLVENLAPHFDRTTILSFRCRPAKTIYEDHVSLLKAIEQKDAAAAHRIAGQHMQRYTENLSTILEAFPHYFKA